METVVRIGDTDIDIMKGHLAARADPQNAEELT